MKKAIKVILPVLLLVVLMVGTTVNTYAFTIAQTHTIDNDDAQGYSNQKVGFDTLIQGSNLYYQDARRENCASGGIYSYFFPEYARYTPITVQISAYLYHSSFTDSAANYGFFSSDPYSFFSVGTINQDLAAPGWNVIGSNIARIPLGGKYSVTKVNVETGPYQATKYCGADAVKVELGYN